MAKKNNNKSASIWRRLWPALIFMMALVVLMASFYDSDYKKTVTAIEDTAKARYDVAKKVFDDLKAQEDVSYKQWNALANEFYAIYEEYEDWPNRPAALFRNALIRELSAREKDDYLAAIEQYTKLAHEFSTSRLADDALLQAAILQSAKLSNDKEALQLLEYTRTHIPRGDMYEKVIALEKNLNVKIKQVASKKRLMQNDATQENIYSALTQVSWASTSKHTVKIIVELDKHTTWHVAEAKGQSILLVIDNASLSKGVYKGARVKGSLLTKLVFTEHEYGSVKLKLDFDKNPTYQTKIEQNPFRIVLTATTRPLVPKDKKIKKSLKLASNTVEDGTAKAKAKPKAKVENKTPKPSNVSSADASSKKALPVKLEPKVAPPKNNVSTTKKIAESKTIAKPKNIAEKNNAKAKSAADTEPKLSAAELSKRMHKANTNDMALQLGLSVQTVFIDIGHGGRDPGAIANGIVERDTVLDIGLRVGKVLKTKGLNVVYSRTTDKAIPLSVRPAQANDARADLFVSIHVNANKDKRVHGFETYYLNFAKNSLAAQTAALENATSDRKLGDMQDLLANVMLNVRTTESIDLADDVQQATMKQLRNNGFKTKNGGTRSAPFHVLIGTGMPAILVEVGYCSNKNEANQLKQIGYRKILAKGIADGIIAYKKRFEKGQSLHFALTNKDDGAM